MAEIWGAAIAVGGAVISASAKAKQDDKNASRDAANARAATRDEAKYSSLLSQFENEQAYYYNQLNRQNKQRGLAEFRKFSNLSNYAPGYTQDVNTGVVLPDKPDASKILEGIPDDQKPAKAKRSLMDKLGNPAGL